MCIIINYLIIIIMFRKNYKNSRTSNENQNKKMAMLIWLNSNLRTQIHQVNIEKITDYKPLHFKIVSNIVIS